MLLVLGIPVLSLLTVAVALRNISIDDSFGDESTHDVPTYTPPSKWTVSGRATPNASLAYKGTWHDTTSHPLDANHTASFSFTGVSLYVYCIIANTPPPGQQFFDTFADYIFFLDKEWVGNYEHDVEKTHDFFYNVPVYVNQTMENKLHSFSIVAHSNDRPVLLLFDYAIYTSEDNTGDATSSARKPKVTYTSREENGPESHVYLGTIVCTTLGGIAFLLCIGIFIAIQVRRRQRAKGISGQFPLSNCPDENAIVIAHINNGDTIQQLRQTIQDLRAEKRVLWAAMPPPRTL
ncbi:hypothetical protein EYR36_009456 [Pleurotus pulmonarius]|nr:hypothetical protein EYR36_009456 [Pleurotus pulmonarius]